MNKYSVIIPVNELSEKERELLKRAIASVPKEADTIIVTPNKSVLAGLEKSVTKVVENKGDSSFSAQVNKGVSECSSEWFTVLELDDELRPGIFSNVEKYGKFHSASIYLPLVEIRDTEDKVQGFMNEIGWANSFCKSIGDIEIEELMLYYDFHCTGAVIRRKDFLEIGGLKESMRIAFWHEFLLRARNSGKGIYVVPKVGYYHTVGREGSLSEGWKEISVEEGLWWIKLSQSEYHHKEDRKIQYKG